MFFATNLLHLNMHPEEFELLSDHVQAAVILNGTLLEALADGSRILQLYSVDTFYVELIYDKRQGKVTEINALTTTDQLLPYLKSVSLGINFS